MKQTAKIISVYSSDSFGVASALFELDGMVVIHDPSGCNSTFTTHDEPRWYSQDSRLYISALTDMDAIMGDDDKFISDVVAASEAQHPRFIALCGSPVPFMMGTDLEALARILEKRTGLPCFGFATNSMHSYVQGAGTALAAVANRLVLPLPFCKNVRQKFMRQTFADETQNNFSQSNERRADDAANFFSPRVNILGVTPLDFSVNGSAEAIADYLTQNGFAVQSRWSLGTTLDEVQGAANADVNLVVSSVGLPTAQTLRKRFGQPYVVGAPFGFMMQQRLRSCLLNAYQSGKNFISYQDVRSREAADPCAAVIGEGVTSCSLATAVAERTGLNVRVICPLEIPGRNLLSSTDKISRDETELEILLRRMKYIIADPMYKPICPDTALFVPLPHEAFSGRLYRKRIPNLVTHFDEWLASWYNL